MRSTAKVLAIDGLPRPVLKLKELKEKALVCKSINVDIITLHERLGHKNVESIRAMIKNNVVTDVKIGKNVVDQKCEVCLMGKIKRSPFPIKCVIKSSSILDLVHSDLCGPMNHVTPSGGRYFLTFIDDYSRYIIKNKCEVYDKFRDYVHLVENITGKTIKTLRSDSGGEYVNSKLTTFLREKGIKHRLTVPYTAEQNGVAERKNQILQDMAKCMLVQAKMKFDFWAEAIMTSNYIQNRTMTKLVINKTPFEVWFGFKPKLYFFRIFGCKAVAHIPKIKRSKLDPKGEVYRFIGYSDQSKGYRLLDEATNKVVVMFHLLKTISSIKTITIL